MGSKMGSDGTNTRSTAGTARQTAVMKTLGIWLSLLGAGCVVLSSGWLTFSTWRERGRLIDDWDDHQENQARIVQLETELTKRWGKQATYNNYEATQHYDPDPDLDRLRKEFLAARKKREAGRWYSVQSDLGTPRNHVKLVVAESAWQEQKWQGTVALIGGVAAFVGAILTAAAG